MIRRSVCRSSFATLVMLVPAWTSACAHSPAPDGAASASAASPSASSAPPAATSATPTEATSPADAAPAAAVASSATPPAAEPPLEGLEFLPEARVLFRVAACGASGEMPARFDAGVVAHHCEELGRAYAEYEKSWVDLAKPFLAALRPKDLPRVVVYPFGGGDLVTALTTFPDSSEITTVSLEPAGDIRPMDKLPGDRLAHELAVHRSHLERLFEKAHSRTDNLEKESKTELPGEVLFALAALVVDGDEPVSLRYFHLRPDGSVAYLTQADIDAAAHHPAATRELFQNAELRFRAAGSPTGEVRVLRHVAFNLDDAHLKADPSLLAYLNGKGKVAAMTKAATHLLWNPHFALIRGYLIDHTDWMISDSTGLPPRFAGPAGYTQETYGRFDGPSEFGAPDRKDAEDVRKLFASQPTRELAFRYGYPDKNGHAHLIVTRRGESSGSRPAGSAEPAGSGAPGSGSPGPAPAKPGANP
jgi:hypothetical protein